MILIFYYIHYRNINSDKSNKYEKKDNQAKRLIQKDNDIKFNKIESLIPDKENITNILATALVNLKISSGEFLTYRAVIDSRSQMDLEWAGRKYNYGFYY